MLVLNRIVGESIVIGGLVKVSVLEVKGKIAKIGIDAPKEVSINRMEIHNRIIAENDIIKALIEENEQSGI